MRYRCFGLINEQLKCSYFAGAYILFLFWGNIVSKLWKFPFQWCTICRQSSNCDVVINCQTCKPTCRWRDFFRSESETLVWSKSFLPKYDILWCFLKANHNGGGCFSFVKCVSDFTVGGGFWGPPPDIFLVKIVQNRVIIDKINMEMALSWKPEIACTWREKLGLPFWTWKWFRFFKYLHYVSYWRAERARKKWK